MSKLPVTQENFERFMQARVPGFFKWKCEWPDLCCDWTSKRILWDVNERFEGDFRLAVGWFNDGWDAGRTIWQGHTWVIETESRVFLDPTAGQFGSIPLPVWRVFFPSDEEYQLYALEQIWRGPTASFTWPQTEVPR